MQSSEGTKRLEILRTDTTCQLFEKVHDAFELESYAFALYKTKSNKDEICSSKSKTILSTGLNHGDMIYLTSLNGAVIFSKSSTHVSNIIVQFNSLKSALVSRLSHHQENRQCMNQFLQRVKLSLHPVLRAA